MYRKSNTKITWALGLAGALWLAAGILGCGDDAGGHSDGGTDTDSDTGPIPGPVCEALAGATCYYVALDGSDENPGTIEEPFHTFLPAVTQAGPGDFIYARGGAYGQEQAMVHSVWRDLDSFPATSCPDGQVLAGEYCYSDTLTMIGLRDFSGWASNTPAHTVASGEEGNPITVRSYPGEHVILDVTGFATRAVVVSLKAYWVIQGFEIIGGMVNIGGGTSELQTHDITIRENHIHDIVVDGGDNPGIVRINRGDIGGPYNIFVHDNELHSIFDAEFPGEWQNVPDAQHFGAVTTLSREIYLGYDGGGTGYIEIVGNVMYHVPQVFFFKNPMHGPVLIQDNRIYDSGRLGLMIAANVHMVQNRVQGVPTGWWGVGNEGDPDERMVAIAGQNAIIEYNTFLGLNSLMSLRCGTGHLVEHNVLFGLTGRVQGANWNTPSYLSKGGGSYPDPLDPAESLLQEMSSDLNCFITPHADFQHVSRYLPPSVTGADWLLDHFSLVESQSLFGFDLNSPVILEEDPAAIFVDPDEGNLQLLDPSRCPGMGYHAYSEK